MLNFFCGYDCYFFLLVGLGWSELGWCGWEGDYFRMVWNVNWFCELVVNGFVRCYWMLVILVGVVVCVLLFRLWMWSELSGL